jgi:hypothetical protein
LFVFHIVKKVYNVSFCTTHTQHEFPDQNGSVVQSQVSFWLGVAAVAVVPQTQETVVRAAAAGQAGR